MVQYEDVKKTFAELVSIDSPSLHEEQMAERIKKLFAEIGITLCEDDSVKITGSATGNLYAYVKGGEKNHLFCWQRIWIRLCLHMGKRPSLRKMERLKVMEQHWHDFRRERR